MNKEKDTTSLLLVLLLLPPPPPPLLSTIQLRLLLLPQSGGAVAQPVERTTPGEEGSIPAVAARSPLVRQVSV